jgi:hypothetical protein
MNQAADFKFVEQSIDASRKRLGVEQLDLVQCEPLDADGRACVWDGGGSTWCSVSPWTLMGVHVEQLDLVQCEPLDADGRACGCGWGVRVCGMVVGGGAVLGGVWGIG